MDIRNQQKALSRIGCVSNMFKNIILAINLIIIFCLTSYAQDNNHEATPNENIFTPHELHYLSALKNIKKCVDPLWMPFEGINKSGEHVGIIADISHYIESQINVPIVLVPTKSWLESIEKLKNRECDILTSDAIDGEVLDFYTKTDPFMSIRNVFITRKDAPIEVDFAKVMNKPIGITEGYPTIELIKKYYGNVNLVEVKNASEGLLKVSNGELYAYTDLLPVCSFSIQNEGLSNLKVGGHLDISIPTVMGVRSDMPELVAIINKIFTTFDNSTLNQFYSNWIKVEYDMKFNWGKLMLYTSLFLLLIILILYWNRKLQKLNKSLDKANEKLNYLNERDPLTGLKNRQFLHEKLPRLVDLAMRNKLSIAVAMLDIDYFKKLNDEHGHLTGDECLKEFAKKIKNVFQRESDVCIRYGGEEFLIICIGITENIFENLLEELRKEAELTPYKCHSGKEISMTASIGYVYQNTVQNQWDDSFIDAADKNLYKAKQAGRNTVIGNELT